MSVDAGYSLYLDCAQQGSLLSDERRWEGGGRTNTQIQAVYSSHCFLLGHMQAVGGRYEESQTAPKFVKALYRAIHRTAGKLLR